MFDVPHMASLLKVTYPENNKLMKYYLQKNEGSLIKPSFAQPGLKHPSRQNITAEEIAAATASVLVRSVPIGVAGVVFLSGAHSLLFVRAAVH